MQIILAAILIAGGCLSAAAQSSTATSGTIAPPSSGTMPNGQPKYQPPPAARSGEKGLRVGNDAAEVVDIKRKK
jgi:hypothetical protein